MKVKLMVFFILIVCISANAQSLLEEEITSNGQTIVKINLNNIFTMMEMSPTKWKNELEEASYESMGYRNNSLEMSKGNSLTGIHTIGKAPNTISTVWLHSGIKATILDDLQEELSDYYTGVDEGNLIYRFSKDGYGWTFGIKRDDRVEWVIVTVQSL